MTAVAAADLSATEIANAAADKPILGHNAAKVANMGSQCRWTATTTGVHDTASVSTTAAPLARIFDGLPPIRSAPTQQTAFTIFLEFSAVIEFDAILYLDHNLYTQGVTALVLQVGDDEDMTNATTISTIDPSAGSSDKRLADLALESGGGTARRYTADYMRITMTKGGAAFDPVLGQVVFLRRQQLSHQPDNPWDTTNQGSSMDRFKARSNLKLDTVRNRGCRSIDARERMNTTALQTAITDWYAGTNEGTEPLIWIDEPASSPTDFFFGLLVEPELRFPWTLPAVRDFKLSAEEQPPHLSQGL